MGEFNECNAVKVILSNYSVVWTMLKEVENPSNFTLPKPMSYTKSASARLPTVDGDRESLRYETLT